MLVNRHAWKMSSEMSGIIQEKVDDYNWRLHISENMLNLVDPIDKSTV